METHRQIRTRSSQLVGIAEYGDPRGRPLLYFHGWPGSRRQAAPSDAIARAHGQHVFALDRPGIGLTPCRQPWTIPQWAQTVVEVTDVLGLERFGLLAISGGCPSALALARIAPERLERVVICSGAPEFATIANRSKWLPAYRLLAAVGGACPATCRPLLFAVRCWMHLLPGDLPLRMVIGALPPEDRAALRRAETLRTIAESIRSAFCQGSGTVLRDGLNLIRPWGFDVAGITLPVTFFHGRRDVHAPITMLMETLRRVPKHRLFEFPNEAHYSLPLGHLDTLFTYLADESPPPAGDGVILQESPGLRPRADVNARV